MFQTLDDIAELAETISNSYFLKGEIAIYAIAKKNGIEIIYGKYGNYFDGLLCYDEGKFYMHLNIEKVPDKQSERMRFTIAHELGHFFIDKHRKKLERGISLSLHSELSDLELKRIEHEANHFASNLLMPKKKFCATAKKEKVGLEAIILLKKKFKTSVYSTTKHYIYNDLSPSIMLRWNPDFSFHYASYSSSFSYMTKITGKPLVSFPSKYMQGIAKIIDEECYDYYECSTQISSWIDSVKLSSKYDFPACEQTIRLGDYGGITLLTLK